MFCVMDKELIKYTYIQKYLLLILYVETHPDTGKLSFSSQEYFPALRIEPTTSDPQRRTATAAPFGRLGSKEP